jgi:hypothetical protein
MGFGLGVQRLHRDRAERKTADRCHQYCVFGFHDPLLVYWQIQRQARERPVAMSEQKEKAKG